MPKFEPYNGGWRCPECFEVHPPSRLPPWHNCQPKPVQRPVVPTPITPSLQPAAEKLGIKPEHIRNYSQALSRWAKAGFPTRTQAEVDVIVTEHCEPLVAAGFDEPRLFIDGPEDNEEYKGFGLPCTTHHPGFGGSAGNWILALWELYARNPEADRYAIFEDDIITYPNLRKYLDACEYPETGYWNLFTSPRNQKLAPPDKTGWYLSNQRGKGALGLVFSLSAVTTLLSRPSLVGSPQSGKYWKSTDGLIVTAFAEAGWKEYVHNPTLVQHTGRISTMGKRKHLPAESFQGENFDAMELLCLK